MNLNCKKINFLFFKLIKENRGSDPCIDLYLKNSGKHDKSPSRAHKTKELKENDQKKLKINSQKKAENNGIADMLEKNIYIKNDANNEGKF